MLADDVEEAGAGPDGEPSARSTIARSMKDAPREPDDGRLTSWLALIPALLVFAFVGAAFFPSADAPPVVLFEDHFVGPAGSIPDPAKWTDQTVLGDKCEAYQGQACTKAENAFLNGAGHLVLRVKREPDGWLGHAYSGAQLGSFLYGWGWPTPAEYRRFLATPPYTAEFRVAWPHLPGGYGTLWMITADRPTSEYIHELDVADERMATTVDDSHLCAQHRWLHGADTLVMSARWAADLHQWHTYKVVAGLDRTDYYLDGDHCGTGIGTDSNQGVLMNWGLGDPNAANKWYVDYGSTPGIHQPEPADPGPWDVLVDYVRITAG